MTKLINFFSKQTILILKEKKSDLTNNLNKLYEFLSKNIVNDKKYGEIINAVFLNEFNKVIYEDYRKKIIEIILGNNDLIKDSTQIMTIIINNTLDHTIEGITKNLDKLHDSQSKIIKMLNKAKKIFLDEILINIFETKINIYFDLIRYAPDEKLEKYYNKLYLDKINDPDNDTGIILEQSFYTFKKYIEYLELAALGKKKKHNSHLIKLYTLTYIKIYLSKLVYFIKEKYKKLGNISEIMNVIRGKKNNNFRKVIKIYIFKLLNSLCKNYEEFQNFDFFSHDIDFANEFKIVDKDNQELLANYFIPLDTDEIYRRFMEQFNYFEISKKNKFSSDYSKKMASFIKTNGIDMLNAMSMNKIISYLGLKNISQEKKNIYHLFSNFTKNLFQKDYIFKSQNMKDLLSLFYDENIYNSKMRPKLLKNNNINQTQFEIVLHAFRFCVQTLSIRESQQNNNILLFESLLSRNCLNNLKGTYVPGNDYVEDLHITSYEEIENHLNTLADNHGCYVCSCGYYYAIEPCGFPSRGNTSKCPVCKLDIGWGPKVVDKGYSQHGMVIRPGHYRIYKNLEQKRTCESRFGDPSENIPNKILADYKREIVDPLLKGGRKGLIILKKQLFLKIGRKIRNLSTLSYRLVHFIVYSHLFFANCMGYISDIDMKNNCLVEDMTCLEIIEKDWEIMKEILLQKGINSIQIFMNLIFIKISSLIKKWQYCLDNEPRDALENEIEAVINKCIKEYNNFCIKYTEENKNQFTFDNYDIRAIICELNPPNEKIYSKKKYPLLKYFMLTKYKSKDDFIKKLGPLNQYINKYPLLGQYLIGKPGPKKMKYLPNFNEFINYMIDNYSFKISRDDAKNRILEKEEIFKKENFSEKFNNFINSWNNIKNDAIKYKCRPEMEIKSLSKKDSLSYFLNDDAELGNGMYLAAACQNFIFWQNDFLQPIIDNIKYNGILHYYVNSLQKKFQYKVQR